MPILAPVYPITTERLLLRPLEVADAGAVHAYASLPEVFRHIPFELRTLDDVFGFIDRRRAQTELTDENQAIGVAAVRQDTGELIGDLVLIWRSRDHGTAEIGYVFDPRHHGQGYATEAARALVDLAFGSELGIHRVIARTDARNEASQRLARRLGMRQEAVLVENEWFKGEWTTEIDFAILRSEWELPQHPR